MAARPTWKGFLKISLVNIPVRVFPATDSAATISFNQLHAECQTRIQQKRWCPSCEREVPMSEIAKGYEFEKGRYVVMTEEDVAKVRPESTRVIDLVQFTDAAAIDPIYVERPYYLAPDGNMATQAFAVMREGMKGKAGIGKLALYGREYLVAVQPKDKGLVMYTMRHAKEVRSMDHIEELDNVPSKVKPEEIKLAKQVIENFEGELNLDEYRHESAAQETRRALTHARSYCIWSKIWSRTHCAEDPWPHRIFRLVGRPWMSIRQCPGCPSTGAIVSSARDNPSSLSVARAIRST